MENLILREDVKLCSHTSCFLWSNSSARANCLLVVVSRSQKHTHTHSVGLPCTSDQPVAEAANFTKHSKHKRRTSNPSKGFKLQIPAIGQLQTYALDRMATWIGADAHTTGLFKMIVGVQLSSGNSAPNSGNNHHLTISSEGSMHIFKRQGACDTPELKVRIRTAIETITADMLQTVWNELDYHVDVCRITKGAHTEHL